MLTYPWRGATRLRLSWAELPELTRHRSRGLDRNWAQENGAGAAEVCSGAAVSGWLMTLQSIGGGHDKGIEVGAP